MFSEAGRSYEKTRIVSPYKTRQRWLYYQKEPVKSHFKEPKPYQTLDTNLRQKRDSYILRYAKDITLNTNHESIYQTVQTTSPRQIFDKGVCERYIGDVRDENFSKQLLENCDHRCAQANNKQLSETKTSFSIESHHSVKSSRHYLSNAFKQQSEVKEPSFSLNKKLQMSQFKSTQPSLMKKRSKLTIQLQQSTLTQRRLKGVSFKSSAGHRYLQAIQKKQQLPEFYQIQKSKESLIRKSFKQPSGDVKFGKYRNSISTRYDRADPYWHLSMDNSNLEIKQKDLSYDFNHYSSRKINYVKSKYPHRMVMNLYMFPVKELKV